MAQSSDRMQEIVSLCKRRGFVFPGSEIYGGLANSWDYGPLGVELKNNIKQRWWRRFVQQRPDVVGIDAALIMNPEVWKASGHLETFTDPLVECKKCHTRYRADQIDLASACANCGAKDSYTEPSQFNLMLKTYLGPSEDSANTVFFRPETAQAMFVDFRQVLDTTRKRLPFGIAQAGKAFRNEITPGNFIFRTREFEQMEIEYFVEEQDWEKYFEHWLEQMRSWLRDLGVDESRIHEVEISAEDRAHYSKRTVDIEYDYPFGQKELYGLAYRTDFDLRNHAQASGADLNYTNPDEQSQKFLPHVIEPTWGVDRSVLVALLEAYTEEAAPTSDGGSETRVVLKFPFWLAPVKIAILPLSKKPELAEIAEPIYQTLSSIWACDYDETQSIGKRYRRQDEIGTPFCITVDFDSIEDQKVTIRHRDTMAQERVAIADLPAYFAQQFTAY